MHWVVAAPYFESADDRWIHNAADSDRHTFTLIPRVGEDRNWHNASATATAGEWLHRARQSRATMYYRDSGIITVFPQLAATVGTLKMARRSDQPLVAWLFNTEGLTPRWKRAFARYPLSQVDKFVVHATTEVEGYAKLLDLPEEKFEYVPLQYGDTVETEPPEGFDEPYVFATGSGYRDYGTFFAAMEKLGYPTYVLAGDRILSGLTVPENVTIMEQITRPEIRRLVRHARVNVVPLTDEALTAGLVTFVETLRHGRAVVTTDRHGVEDYCRHGETALLAKLYDPQSMAEAIDEMWSDEKRRADLDAGALAFADEHCTDEAAAKYLFEVLDSVS